MKQLIGVLAAVLISSSANAAHLFAKPLHLTRVIDDPLTGTSRTVEEYYGGSRAVAMRGDVVVISDVAKSELTIIRRNRGEYSVSTFSEIANARARTSERRSAAQWNVQPSVPSTERTATSKYVVAAATSESPLREATISLSSAHTVTRDELEIIEGISYPNEPQDRQRAILAVIDVHAQASRASAGSCALPVEESLVFVLDGETTRLTSRIVRIGDEPAPDELLKLPDHRIESPFTESAALLDELDTVPAPATKK